ncbi:MAG: rhodanese-like domain-containing protein, partial [Halobacteriota archaeon]
MDEFDLPTPDVPIETITPRTLYERIDADESIYLLDTRMPNEYNEWRIEGSTVASNNIPYFEFIDDEIDDGLLADIPSDREIVVLCAKGGASEFVAGRLLERGYDAVHLEEGMNGWASIYEAIEIEEYDGPGTVI